jgi:hypothetical protein
LRALRDGGVPDEPRVGPSATLDWLPDVHRWQLQRLARGNERDGTPSLRSASGPRRVIDASQSFPSATLYRALDTERQPWADGGSSPGGQCAGQRMRLQRHSARLVALAERGDDNHHHGHEEDDVPQRVMHSEGLVVGTDSSLGRTRPAERAALRRSRATGGPALEQRPPEESALAAFSRMVLAGVDQRSARTDMIAKAAMLIRASPALQARERGDHSALHSPACRHIHRGNRISRRRHRSVDGGKRTNGRPSRIA